MPWFVKWILLPALAAVAIGAGVVAVRSGSGNGGGAEQQGIRQLVPAAGAQVLQQDSVGIVLEPGWDASLSLDGIALPDDQLDKDLDLGQVLYRPEPGKVVEALAPDRNCLTALVWRRERGPEDGTRRTWCFRAS